MICELRSYTFRPGKLQDFVAAFEARALAILAPRLRGFRPTESGVLNRAIHLWEHEDRDGRAQIRAKKRAGFDKLREQKCCP
jgi:NIPSNAP